jgi:hypothetical protein
MKSATAVSCNKSAWLRAKPADTVTSGEDGGRHEWWGHRGTSIKHADRRLHVWGATSNVSSAAIRVTVPVGSEVADCHAHPHDKRGVTRVGCQCESRTVGSTGRGELIKS